MLDKQVLIIGAGISGLYLASRLKQSGISVKIIEARSRLGGRIHSPNGYDLGPAWFWPGQNRIATLLRELDIDFYAQQDEGFGIYQSPIGKQRLPSGYTGLAYRVKNGMDSLIQALAELVGREHILLDSKVVSIKSAENKVELALQTKGVSQYLNSKYVAIALPPRLAEAEIQFFPALPQELAREMRDTPTWMASHAKALIRYETPFWQAQGLSGTALSAKGPLMQIHDASLPDKNEHALFGFIGISAAERQAQGKHLQAAIIQQLTDLFGEQAENINGFELMDWSQEAETATQADQAPLNHHPVYGLSQTHLWQERLHFCSTETAPSYGGFVEGALEAAEHTLNALVAAMKSQHQAA